MTQPTQKPITISIEAFCGESAYKSITIFVSGPDCVLEGSKHGSLPDFSVTSRYSILANIQPLPRYRMTSDDWLSKEEALAGFVGRRAQRLLLMIETRTAYIFSQSRQALRMMMFGQQPEPLQYDYVRSLALMQDQTIQINIHDIEQMAPIWGGAISDNPRLKAVLAHLIAQKYPFAAGDVPRLRAVLGLDDAAVASAYESIYDAPLTDLYAAESHPDSRAFWHRVPGLGPEMMQDMVASMELVQLKWGETLFERGEAGDSMYAIVSGRVRAVAPNEERVEIPLGEWGRGGVLGEMGVLDQNSRRSSTVFAVRESELVRIRRDKFEKLALKHPQLSLFFTRQLASRVRELTAGKPQIDQVATIAILPASPDMSISDFAAKLSRALKTHGSLLHLSSERIQKYGRTGDEDDAEIVWWLNALEMGHRFLLLEADSSLTSWTRRCLQMADRVLIIADANGDPQPGENEADLYGAEINRIATGRELVLLHQSDETLPSGTLRWLKPRHLRRHHHLVNGSEEDLAKLARYLSGEAIGLVLSGGGARGLAHVGTLRAIQESGIPIDAVGGTSFGAIMAGAIGLQWHWKRLYDTTRDFTRQTRRHFRPAIPIVSLMEGRAMNRLFRGYYGDARLEDLWRPLFCLSSNLTQSRMEVHDRGPVWRAVRASMSLPSVFPPVLKDGDLLVDGGVMNSLPSDIMKARLEGGTVIASKTSHEQHQTYSYAEESTSWQMLRSRRQAPSIVDVVTQTMGLASRWGRQQQLRSTDLMIDLPVAQYGLFDYDAFDKLVETGYRTAMNALEDWDKAR